MTTISGINYIRFKEAYVESIPLVEFQHLRQTAQAAIAQDSVQSGADFLVVSQPRLHGSHFGTGLRQLGSCNSVGVGVA